MKRKKNSRLPGLEEKEGKKRSKRRKHRGRRPLKFRPVLGAGPRGVEKDFKREEGRGTCTEKIRKRLPKKMRERKLQNSIEEELLYT